MAKQAIGIGTSANDGTGDTLRDAFDKANDNFIELYSHVPLALGAMAGATPTAAEIIALIGTAAANGSNYFKWVTWTNGGITYNGYIWSNATDYFIHIATKLA